MVYCLQVLKELVEQQSTLQQVISDLNSCNTLCHDPYDEHAANGQQQQPQQGSNSMQAPSILRSKPNNYAAYVLQQTQPADMQRAIAFSPDDWCRYYTEIASKLCLLMEVIAREDSQQQQPQGQQQPQQQGLSHINTDSHQPYPAGTPGVSDMILDLAPAAAATSAKRHNSQVTHHSSSSPGSSSDRSSTTQIAAQTCAATVDDFVRLALLQQILQHGLTPNDPPYFTSYRAAAMVNLITGVEQAETGFREHWTQVAKTLKLTPLQLQKMQICYQQYSRCRAALRQKQLATCQQVECDLGERLQQLGLSDSRTPSSTAAAAASSGTTATSDSSTSSSSAAAAGGGGNEEAESVSDSVSNLGGVLAGIMVANQMQTVFLANMLSYRQLSR